MTDLKDKFHNKKLFILKTPEIYYSTERNQQNYYFDTATVFNFNSFIKETQYEYHLSYEEVKDEVDKDNQATNKFWTVTRTPDFS